MRKTLIAALLLAATASTTVVAQSDVASLRVDKLEKEMRAVQRKVFGVSGATVEPEITGSASGTSSDNSTPVNDLTSRIDALEGQLKALTGQVEQDQNRIRKLEDALKALKTDTDGRLRVLEGTGPAPVAQATPPAPAPAPAPKPVATSISTKPSVNAVPSKTAAPATKIDPARKALVAKVEVPDSGDAGEDTYAYGYRLWDAKLFPEAQVKLKEFIAKFPKHRKTSYANNLLGRAYLDEGKPGLAATVFLDNYKSNPRGDRAPDSLYYLGISLTRLKSLQKACLVFDEFKDVYGATSSSSLKSMVEKGRSDAKCTA
jgi:TolA-binding protein